MTDAIATSQRLTIGMNVLLVLAVLGIAAGALLSQSVLLLGTLGVFVLAILVYAAVQVVLHKRVAREDRATRAESNDGTVLAALRLIRTNLLVYVLVAVVGVGVAYFLGYIPL